MSSLRSLRVITRRRFGIGDSVQMPDSRTGVVCGIAGDMLYEVLPYNTPGKVTAHDLELLPDFTGPFASQPLPRPVSQVIANYSGIERRAA